MVWSTLRKVPLRVPRDRSQNLECRNTGLALIFPIRKGEFGTVTLSLESINNVAIDYYRVWLEVFQSAREVYPALPQVLLAGIQNLWNAFKSDEIGR